MRVSRLSQCKLSNFASNSSGLTKTSVRYFQKAQVPAPVTGVATVESEVKDVTDGFVLQNSRSKTIIPALGFGTWGCDAFDKETMARSVDDALRAGYRHLDCARVYNNEKEIGEVLADRFADGTLKREELFITSKVYNQDHAPPELAPVGALHGTLRDLGVDYVDCFMIHWPFRNHPKALPIPFDPQSWSFTYKLLREEEVKGLTRSVGVSNATVHKLKLMKEFCTEWKIPMPSINQVEMHPYLQQPNLVEYCRSEDILLGAAMPLGSPERPARFKRDDDPVPLADPALARIAEEVGASPVQVVIRWHINRGIVCTPKATEEWMIKENLKALSVQLTQEHMDEITAIDRHYRFARGEVFRWKEDQDWQEFWDGEG